MALPRPAAALTAASLLLAAGAPAQEVSNPDLYAKSLEAAARALEQYGRYENPAELARITEIGYAIAQASGFRNFPITFHLIDMPVPNALALPGGQIFVTRGMLDLGLGDDMLAGLLGHEIAHVAREHGLRMRRRATLLNAISQAVLVGVLIAAEDGRRERGGVPSDPRYPSQESGGGNLVLGTAAAGVVVSELLLRSYSREFEDEADEEGQRWAAAAGYDPDGTRRLMGVMRARIPESKEYGYWRTHPFFEQRVQAAEVRRELLTIQPPKDAAAFRARTQEALLGYLGSRRPEPGPGALVEEAALAAWPRGPEADRLRLKALHALRERVLEEPPLSRDYALLIREYREEMEEVRERTPESPLLATLRDELGEFRTRLADLYPEAARVFRTGVYETDFLETFLSNYPAAPEAPEAALALAAAYGRLGRQADAVARYLEAWEAAPESEAGKEALAGLRSLAPALDELRALQQLASQGEDPELRERARTRLGELAGSYQDLANGATYLKRFPDGEVAETVTRRLNTLADKLYGELVLYQAVGDHVKALDRIEKILTHAPLSPAADRLRERAIVEG